MRAPPPPSEASKATVLTAAPTRVSVRLQRTLAALVWIGLSALMALWALRASLVPMVPGTEAPRAEALPQGLPCLSYAPFRRTGHTPFDPKLRLERRQLEDDLQRLARVTSCIRLYGTAHGLDQVPGVAAELGLSVVLGAWISRDPIGNDLELDRALELARRYPGTVRALVVGNEVLLRRELTPQQLAQLLDKARGLSPVPVTYADVWEFWLRHAPVLSTSVDFVAAHILPYWEDEPVGIADAGRHLEHIVGRLQEELAPLPIWVAETGWPARGRQRGPALPGVAEQALWIAELQAQHRRTGLDVNVIEAFDQPWKRALEGAMGGAWGIFSADGELRPALRSILQAAKPPEGTARATSAEANPVTPAAGDPEARAGLLAAVVGLIWGVGAVVRSRRNPPQLASFAIALPASLALALGALGHHGVAWWPWPRHPAEMLWGALTLLLCALCVLRFMGLFRGPRVLDSALLMLVMVEALTLVFDGRYRMLPWSLCLCMAVLAWLPPAPLRWVGQWNPGHHHEAPALDVHSSPEARLMAMGLGAAAPLLLVSEGLANHQAVGTALGWLALALAAVLRPCHPGAPGWAAWWAALQAASRAR